MVIQVKKGYINNSFDSFNMELKNLIKKSIDFERESINNNRRARIWLMGSGLTLAIFILLLCYFVKLLALPINYRSLKDKVRDLFPITNRFELRNLSFYRRKLALHYDLSKISDL